MLTSDEVIKKIQDKFKNDILQAEEIVPGRIYLDIKKEAVTEISDFIFNKLKGRFLISAGTDRLATEGDFLVTHIFSLDKDNIFVSLKIPISPEDSTIDSISNIIPGANWAEREFRDMVGINPANHPDPRRLVLPDDWPEGIHPLRKDVPYNINPPPAEGMAPKMKEPPEGSFLLPIGPFFPVLEEPSQWRVFISGEEVVGCDYRGFYNHRGIEKLGDSVLTYNQVPFIAERICGICGFIHSSCYCQTVEEAAGIEIPLRAKFIRSICLELERIHSHILWTGIAGHILGFDTVLMQTWRIREPVMWIMEKITGSRKSYGLNLVGGVRRDLPQEIHQEITDVINAVEKEWLAVIDAISGDTPLMMRLKDVGVLSKEDARNICVVGPSVRGSGIDIDARIDHPYAAYDVFPANIVVEEGGDVLARTLVRLKETLESIRYVREALKEMPDGPIMAEIDEEIPAGKEGISVVEAPRGEAIHYIITGEENRPWRWRVRAPTYPNLQAMPVMIQGYNIADVPIILGSLDPCFSCTERLEVVDVKTNKSKIYTPEEIANTFRK